MPLPCNADPWTFMVGPKKSGTVWKAAIFVCLIHLSLRLIHAPVPSFLATTLGSEATWMKLLADRIVFALMYPLAGYLILRHPQPYAILRGILNGKSLAVGILSGGVMYLAVFAYHQLSELLIKSIAPSSPGSQKSELILFTLFTAGIITPILEEVYYRGILQGRLLHERMSFWPALILQALLFALAHDSIAMPPLFFAGIVLGLLYWRWGTTAAILAHTTYNLLILVVHLLYA